jgi:hypothetical protein
MLCSKCVNSNNTEFLPVKKSRSVHICTSCKNKYKTKNKHKNIDLCPVCFKNIDGIKSDLLKNSFSENICTICKINNGIPKNSITAHICKICKNEIALNNKHTDTNVCSVCIKNKNENITLCSECVKYSNVKHEISYVEKVVPMRMCNLCKIKPISLNEPLWKLFCVDCFNIFLKSRDCMGCNIKCIPETEPIDILYCSKCSVKYIDKIYINIHKSPAF